MKIIQKNFEDNEIKKIAKDYIERSARSATALQGVDGSFPPGNNGPWKDIDTPVRNTAHWAYLLYTAYLFSGNSIYRLSALKASEYLLKPENRPDGFTFLCRTTKSKSKCNGLIGQAWAVEPLILIGKYEGRREYIETANNVLKCHEYDKKRKLFKACETDGTDLPLIRAVNQQIWLASSIIRYAVNLEAFEQSDLVPNALNVIEELLHSANFYRNGCFQHTLNPPFIGHAKRMIRSFRFLNFTPHYPLSVGYHSFILAGLALAFKTLPESKIWHPWLYSKRLKTAMKFSIELASNEQTHSPFSFQYNPTGIEIALAFIIWVWLFCDNFRYLKSQKILALQP